MTSSAGKVSRKRIGSGRTSLTSPSVQDPLLDASLTTLLLSLVEEVSEHIHVPRRARVVDRSASPPVPANARLVSRYGVRPGRGTKYPTFHAGIDFHAPLGTHVFAVRPGIVERVSRERSPWKGFEGQGNAIVIHHDDEDRWTSCAHLDELLVTPGSYVVAGQVIGIVGATSNGHLPGMRPHLHFELRDRTRSGLPPFPGRPYRAGSRDPEQWLHDHGVIYNGCGRLVSAPKAGRKESPCGLK